MNDWSPRDDPRPRPVPMNPHVFRRWEEHTHRRRMIEDTWRTELVDALKATIGTQRAVGWGRPSSARNLFRTVCEQLSVLYVNPYEVQCAKDPAAAKIVAEAARVALLTARCSQRPRSTGPEWARSTSASTSRRASSSRA